MYQQQLKDIGEGTTIKFDCDWTDIAQTPVDPSSCVFTTYRRGEQNPMQATTPATISGNKATIEVNEENVRTLAGTEYSTYIIEVVTNWADGVADTRRFLINVFDLMSVV